MCNFVDDRVKCCAHAVFLIFSFISSLSDIILFEKTKLLLTGLKHAGFRKPVSVDALLANTNAVSASSYCPVTFSALPNVPICAYYWYNKAFRNGHSMLLFGDDSGAAHILHFHAPQSRLFQKSFNPQQGTQRVYFNVSTVCIKSLERFFLCAIFYSTSTRVLKWKVYFSCNVIFIWPSLKLTVFTVRSFIYCFESCWVLLFEQTPKSSVSVCYYSTSFSTTLFGTQHCKTTDLFLCSYRWLFMFTVYLFPGAARAPTIRYLRVLWKCSRWRHAQNYVYSSDRRHHFIFRFKQHISGYDGHKPKEETLRLQDK